MTPRRSSLTAYLDECVEPRLADDLSARGFTAIAVRDAGMSSAPDADQLAYAATRDLVLISYNDRDFRRLHRQFRRAGRAHGGIIILPQSGPRGRLLIRAAMMLDWLAEIGDYRSKLFKFGVLQYLLTLGYRLPGYVEVGVRLALVQER